MDETHLLFAWHSSIVKHTPSAHRQCRQDAGSINAAISHKLVLVHVFGMALVLMLFQSRRCVQTTPEQTLRRSPIEVSPSVTGAHQD